MNPPPPLRLVCPQSIQVRKPVQAVAMAEFDPLQTAKIMAGIFLLTVFIAGPCPRRLSRDRLHLGFVAA